MPEVKTQKLISWLADRHIRTPIDGFKVDTSKDDMLLTDTASLRAEIEKRISYLEECAQECHDAMNIDDEEIYDNEIEQLQWVLSLLDNSNNTLRMSQNETDGVKE